MIRTIVHQFLKILQWMQWILSDLRIIFLKLSHYKVGRSVFSLKRLKPITKLNELTEVLSLVWLHVRFWFGAFLIEWKSRRGFSVTIRDFSGKLAMSLKEVQRKSRKPTRYRGLYVTWYEPLMRFISLKNESLPTREMVWVILRVGVGHPSF